MLSSSVDEYEEFGGRPRPRPATFARLGWLRHTTRMLGSAWLATCATYGLAGSYTTSCMKGRVATRRSSTSMDLLSRLHVQLNTRMAYSPNLHARTQSNRQQMAPREAGE